MGEEEVVMNCELGDKGKVTGLINWGNRKT